MDFVYLTSRAHSVHWTRPMMVKTLKLLSLERPTSRPPRAQRGGNVIGHSVDREDECSSPSRVFWLAAQSPAWI